MENAEAGKQPGKQGKLEDDAHYEYHAEEVVHVGVQGYLVGNGLADLVAGKEAECEWEDETVSNGAAEEEHEGAVEESPGDGFLLVLEQGGPDEFPQLIDDIGED